MDVPSPSVRSTQFSNCVSTQEPKPACASDSVLTDSDPAVAKPIKKKKKRNKRSVLEDGSAPQSPPAGTADSSSSSFLMSSSQKVMRAALRRRTQKVLLGGVRRSGNDVEALALPLGMSFAAVITQVLERNEAANDRMSVDHLSMICTSAVRESLANVFGDKFDCFVKNFEKSFGSTLKTLRLINESSLNEGGCHICHHDEEVSKSDAVSNKGDCMNREWRFTRNCTVKDCHPGVVCGDSELQQHMQNNSMEKGGYYAESCSDVDVNKGGHTNKEGSTSSVVKDCQPRVVLPTSPCFSNIEEVQENMLTDPANTELALRGQMNQVVCVSTNSLGSITSQSTFSALEKSVMEQTRSNDLKTLELGISMKRLKLKETQLALNYESNHLERSKLAMGVSKASFKAEKFKSQLEDMRHSELLRKCIDCLVAGLFIMSVSLGYGAYVFSYRRIAEATASCTPSDQESKSWWMPKAMTTFNSGLHILRCQFQVMSRMVFGLLMILLIAFLLLQRSTTLKDSKPVTFILLLLGVFCGFAGKICVDTLGGSGYHWLMYWEVQCLLHFFSNVCTPALFVILHGPVDVSPGSKSNPILPYWSRRVVFYAMVLLFLPLFCGLMPFASIGEWKTHFSQLTTDSVEY